MPYVVFSLAKHSAELGHEVTVIERKWDGAQPFEMVDGIKFIRINLGFGSNTSNAEPVYSKINRIGGVIALVLEKLSFSLKVYSIIHNSEYDVIHFHLPFSSNLLVRMSKNIRKRAIYTAHVGQENLRFSLGTKISVFFKVLNPDLMLIKKIRKTVLLNEALRAKLMSKGLSQELFTVIPNGIERPAVPEALRMSREGLSLEYHIRSKVVLFSGTVIPRKGVDILLKAIALLKQRDYTAVIIGRLDADPDYVEHLRGFAEKNKLNVVFTGFVDYGTLVSLYEIADVGVLPSFEEGDPLSLKEMIACGIPVIGSKISGISQQILDGKNGFLFQVGDFEDLSKKLEIILNDDSLRNEFSKSSLNFSANFTWERTVKKYIDLYNSICLKNTAYIPQWGIPEHSGKG